MTTLLRRVRLRAPLSALVLLLLLALNVGGAAAATSVTLYAGSLSAPSGGLWLPGPAGSAGHLWSTDAELGLCRVDPAGLTNCVTTAHVPGQPAFDPTSSSVYVPDSAVASTGVHRLHFNQATETIDADMVLRPTDGLAGNRPSTAALDPLTGALYVGFLRAPNIVRITQPSIGIGDPKVVIGNSSDGKQTFSMGFLDVSGSVQLVEADSRGLGQITNPAACTGNCSATPMALGIAGPLSLLVQNNTSLFVGNASSVSRYDALAAVSASNPSAYAAGFSFVSGLALDPAANIYALDDPSRGATPGSGHAWLIAQVVTPVAQATAPGAPTAVSATASNASASVSWTAPTADGGSAITSYMVTSSPAGASASVAAPATSATLTGLTNGTAYTFTVTATNAVGTSPASLASNSVTPITVPGAPTAVSATGGNAQATVTWTAPASNGGSPVTSYTVSSTPAGASAAVTGGATSVTLMGLTPGTAYTFSVVANNAAGASAPSAASNSVTPFTVPGAPTAVNATAASAQVTVVWTAPASDGGSAISSYTVTSSPAGANATVTGTSATITGLSNGTAYTFTVTAANAAGNSAPSAPSNSVTPSGPSTPVITQNPPNPTGNPNVTFGFTSSFVGATFQCSLVPLGAADTFSVCTSPRTYGPLADGAYTFKLTATDPASGSTSSPTVYEFNVGTLTAPSATAPIGRSAQGAHATTAAIPVTISWSATACTTGAVNCNIVSYHLQRSINGFPFADVALPSATATGIVDNLTPSPTNQATVTTYTYRVQATNAQGQVSAFAIGPTFSVPVTDNNGAVSYSGPWSSSALAGAYGGTVHSATVAGSFATLASGFSGSAVALVSTLGPDRGLAQITVDGLVVATADLYAPTLQSGQIVWSTNGLAPGAHTIKVTALGAHNAASTGARVDIDAFVVLK